MFKRAVLTINRVQIPAPKIKFDYLKMSNRAPAVECAIRVIHDGPRDLFRGTVAALILPNGAVYTGTAIAVPGDTFEKKLGNQRALGHAFRAWFHGECAGYVSLHAGDTSAQISAIARAALQKGREDAFHRIGDEASALIEKIEAKMAEFEAAVFTAYVH